MEQSAILRFEIRVNLFNPFISFILSKDEAVFYEYTFLECNRTFQIPFNITNNITSFTFNVFNKQFHTHLLFHDHNMKCSNTTIQATILLGEYWNSTSGITYNTNSITDEIGQNSTSQISNNTNGLFIGYIAVVSILLCYVIFIVFSLFYFVNKRKVNKDRLLGFDDEWDYKRTDEDTRDRIRQSDRNISLPLVET